MELIINENTTIEEYEAWLSHPETTIAMMRESSSKWADFLDRQDKANIKEIQHAAALEHVSMKLMEHVVKEEMIMEELLSSAKRILYVTPKYTKRPYQISDDSFQFEVDLIDKLEAKKFRNRVKNVLLKVAGLVGAGLMVIHNLL